MFALGWKINFPLLPGRASGDEGEGSFAELDEGSSIGLGGQEEVAGDFAVVFCDVPDGLAGADCPGRVVEVCGGKGGGERQPWVKFNSKRITITMR
jgi:hypothetical protein